jgi:hypothetical protein
MSGHPNRAINGEHSLGLVPGESRGMVSACMVSP